MTTMIYEFMAIKWRLSAVMADREIDNQVLHQLTGLHPGTISKLRNNPPSRIDTITLNLLCTALNCQPGELLHFIPDTPQENFSNRDDNKLLEFRKTESKAQDHQDKTQSAA